MATQRYIVEQKGSQGAHVKTVLRHLSFAKQRFDSSVAPARKVCVMFAALVLLLIGVVCDERLDGKQRRRAQRQLDDLTPSRITAAGLFADYTAVVTQFVRISMPTTTSRAFSARKSSSSVGCVCFLPMGMCSLRVA